MTIKQVLKIQISHIIDKLYDLKEVDFQLEYPPYADMGDYSCNVAMAAAPMLKRKAMEIGKEIVGGFRDFGEMGFGEISVVEPGFINFYLSEEFLQHALKEILKQKEKFGSSKIGKNRKIVIDYSSPNVAKNMHVGHLRSTIIGDAMARIFEFLDYKVISDNHLGDWGTQYGILLYAYKNKYADKLKQNLSVDELEGLYINFKKQEKKDEKLIRKARAELKKLQDGDKTNLKLWQYFYKISIKEFGDIYERLKIRKFDFWHGESFYSKMLQSIVWKALKKRVAERSQGAVIIDLKRFNLPPMLIQKSDNAFLYATFDLAALDYRYKKFKPEKIIYVVGNEQALHFEQLFAANKLLALAKDTELIHVKFGLMIGDDRKKLSTRKGGVLKLNELIQEIITKARQIVEEKNPDLEAKEKNRIAEVIGIGALKYNDLSQNRLSDIFFNLKKMLNFESGSAPYLQYTFVRIQSILKKAKIKQKIKNLDKLKEPQETLLLKALIKFPEVILDAAAEYRPNLIANYLEKLAGNFHSYYETVPIIKSDKEIQMARLILISAVAQVIKNGLNLLGIEVLEKM